MRANSKNIIWQSVITLIEWVLIYFCFVTGALWASNLLAAFLLMDIFFYLILSVFAIFGVQYFYTFEEEKRQELFRMLDTPIPEMFKLVMYLLSALLVIVLILHSWFITAFLYTVTCLVTYVANEIVKYVLTRFKKLEEEFNLNKSKLVKHI